MLRYLPLVVFPSSAISVPVRKRPMIRLGSKSVSNILLRSLCSCIVFVGHHISATFLYYHRTISLEKASVIFEYRHLSTPWAGSHLLISSTLEWHREGQKSVARLSCIY